MSNLENRVKKLETGIRPKHEPRFMIVTNVPPRDNEETPYRMKITIDQWAHAIRGGPFTSEEVRGLKDEHEGSKR